MAKPPYVVGLMWNALTPQVEGKIVQDLIAIQSQPQVDSLAVYYKDARPEFQKMLATMGIQRTPTEVLATLWIVYQTGVHQIEAPEHAREVVVRNLSQGLARPNLSVQDDPGFYLTPQGREIAPTLDINRPMPGWYPGGPTPAVVWLWS